MSPVKIHLRPVGAAPQLAQTKFKLDGSKNLLEVQTFLRKKLSGTVGAVGIENEKKEKEGEKDNENERLKDKAKEKEKEKELSLFLYCGSGFSPTMDQSLEELFRCFAAGDELIIMYGIQEAWG